MRRAVHVHLHRGGEEKEQGPTLRALWSDLLARMAGALDEIRGRTGDAEWKEDLHPRRSDGKFGHGQVHADQEPPQKPTSSSAKGGMDKVRELLLSGHPFSREELLAATGLKDKRLGDYLAMLKNPKWAGPKGALKIERDAKGMYFVAKADGAPAPLPPVVARPPAPPAWDRYEANRHAIRDKRDTLNKRANDLMTRMSGDMGGSPYQAGKRAQDHLKIIDHYLDESRRTSATDDYRLMYLGKAELALTAAQRELDYGLGREQVLLAQQAEKARIAKETAAAAGRSGAPDVSRPWFFKATSKEVADDLVKRGYAAAADFGKLDATIANEYGKSLHEHMIEFPALSQRMDFAGSSQAYYKRWVDGQVERNLEQARRWNPGRTDDEHRAEIRKRIKTPKVPGKAWALSHRGGPGLNAVTVNEKHATPKEMVALEANLKRGTQTQWHPVACDTVKSIIDHELGHKLDELLGLKGNSEILALRKEAHGGTDFGPNAKANMTRAVSAYAATNAAEFIAEAWAEYRNNPNPRPVAARLGEIVRREYARQHPAPQEEARRAA